MKSVYDPHARKPSLEEAIKLLGGNSYNYRLDAMVTELAGIQRRLEVLIGAVPTSALRDRLTEHNIHMGLLIREMTKTGEQ